MDGVGRLTLRDDPARLKGLRSEGGYADVSRLGTGGASLAVVLRPLNALFIEAKDDFLEGTDVIDVATEDVGACPKLVFLAENDCADFPWP